MRKLLASFFVDTMYMYFV